MATERNGRRYGWLGVAVTLAAVVFGAAGSTLTWSFCAGQEVATIKKDVQAGNTTNAQQDARLDKLQECATLSREQYARIDERLKAIDTRQVQIERKLDRALAEP